MNITNTAPAAKVDAPAISSKSAKPHRRTARAAPAAGAAPLVLSV